LTKTTVGAPVPSIANSTGRPAISVVSRGSLLTAASAKAGLAELADHYTSAVTRGGVGGQAWALGGTAGLGRAGILRAPMSIFLASAIVAVVAAVAIAAMLLVRRRAPEGSYFEDGDRAAGVFGVLATGFALLAGFVVFLAFASYDTSRGGAEAEARIVAHQFETVQFLASPARERLSGELVCYARSVVHQEWPRMKSGTLGNAPNPWGVALFRSPRATQPRSASEQAAFSKYLDERSDREDARGDRAHGSEGVPDAGVDRPALERRDPVRVHALLRRQR
jgi:hypothetical protein